MKLRNKKTGEIVNNNGINFTEGNYKTYNSLAEFNEEWEDVPEEPRGFWSISGDATIEYYDRLNENDRCKEIGNYFDTREEAEKAVEKLKAIQRLKNYYLKFKLDFVKNKIDFTYRLDGTLHSSVDEQRIIFEDMNLLFGGEE